jgi:Ni,Fe-hydrogenase I large subunit
VVAGPADPWLEHGALTLGPGEGMAWSEMARGLLVHWVRLDPAEAASPGADPQVDDCRVIAPTEWNFHPHGAVAGALATLPTSVRTGRVRLLAAAFDPCVELEIERSPDNAQHDTEVRHA